MFKRKKKNDIIIEEEIIVATTDTELELEDTEIIQDIKITDNEIIDSEDLVVGNFTYHDSDPNNECSVDENEETVQTTEDDEVEKSEKKELSSYFEDSKKDNSKIKEEKAKEKRTSKRKQRKEAEFYKVKNQKVFIFRNKKYVKVEDFIKYLNSHYLEIDKISQEILDDENFYGWLSKKSGVFDDSIKQFKEIKEKIEKK